jgi:hypothetical protein
MGKLREDLGAEADEVRETHISWVFLAGDDVFKVKKPVAFSFLDFSTAERRLEACEAEVRLNARLSPEVYLGVRKVVIGDDGRHAIGGGEDDGREVVDWAVHMRRLRDEDRADVRLEAGALGVAEIDRMAARIAGFHAECRRDDATDALGAPAAIGENVRENFEQTRRAIGTLVTDDEAREIESWQLGFLEREAALFEARIASGHVRDGHGDLRLEHFYLEGESSEIVRVLDCIEFNERFRFADVASDLAFLSMDLAWHGRVDLAERLLATYAQETNDFDLYALVDFYESYRAYVRGKVATMLAADEGAPAALRERARSQARRYFLLALAAERKPLVGPIVVAVGGVIASGKSTLSDRLGALLGAPAINTDRIRKHLVGARPTDRLYDGSWAGAYDPAFTEEVYAEVRRLASVVVRSGRPVILDASFRSVSMRAEARDLAQALGVPFAFVECRADPEVCRARLRVRDMKTSVSDGRLDIFDDFLTKWQPVSELPPEAHVVIDTTQPIETSLRALRERLPMWPEGLTD